MSEANTRGCIATPVVQGVVMPNDCDGVGAPTGRKKPWLGGTTRHQYQCKLCGGHWWVVVEVVS